MKDNYQIKLEKLGTNGIYSPFCDLKISEAYSDNAISIYLEVAKRFSAPEFISQLVVVESREVVMMGCYGGDK